jgi:hypothetical protein
MKLPKEHSLNEFRFIERINRHVGQPTVIRPKREACIASRVIG